MRRSVFALGALAALGVGSAAFGQSVYTPISLAPSSFNEDVVIEATATTPLKSSITATMDNGEGLGGDTWFESGLPLANKPDVGFPAGAGVITSAADPNTTFLLQPYAGKNALLLNNHVNNTPVSTPTGTFTLTTPTAVGGLKFFASSGNGAGTVAVTIHHADGVDSHTTLTVPDWFDSNPPKNQAAIVSNGRVNPGNNAGAGSFDNFGQTPPNPRVYEIPFNDLGNATDPITSIDFSFTKAAGSTNTAIFGISGSPTPEPGTLSLIALGGLGLLRRRRA